MISTLKIARCSSATCAAACAVVCMWALVYFCLDQIDGAFLEGPVTGTLAVYGPSAIIPAVLAGWLHQLQAICYGP